MFKKLLCVGLFSFAYAGGIQQEDPSLGNWTKSYAIKTGDVVLHTPSSVQMGFMVSGKALNINAKSFNGVPLKAPLVLKVKSTPTEFEEALRMSGLID